MLLVGVPSHSTIAPGSLTVDDGFTVISKLTDVPGQPLMAGVTVMIPV